MMRYWWVNHKQTSRFEIPGGFLWSPMLKANGRSNYFYDTMRKAVPGDLVISYSDSQISFVGRILEFAIPAPKPPVFGDTGGNWDKNNGWLLSVSWSKLDESISPKHKIEELKVYLPFKYSPISATTGHGNQGAYFSEVGKEVFDCLIPVRYMESSKTFVGADIYDVLKAVDDAVEDKLLADNDLELTTKKALVDSRLGQGLFKKRIYEFENSCRITRVSTPGLLIASHIKPWRICTSSFERLDGANGLLLTANVDLLFDRGLISFDEDGRIMVSDKLSFLDLKLLGLDSAVDGVNHKFHDRQLSYMAFHREKVFLK